MFLFIVYCGSVFYIFFIFNSICYFFSEGYFDLSEMVFMFVLVCILLVVNIMVQILFCQDLELIKKDIF